MRYRIKEITYKDDSTNIFIQERKQLKIHLPILLVASVINPVFFILLVIGIVLFPITLIVLYTPYWESLPKSYTNMNEAKMKLSDLIAQHQEDLKSNRENKEKAILKKENGKVKRQRIITTTELTYK